VVHRRRNAGLGVCDTLRVELVGVLDVFTARDCRFVVVGSGARQLLGEHVTPSDLDVVVGAEHDDRHRLVEAMIDLGAVVRVRGGHRVIGRSISLPWEWGWSVLTAYGSVDVIVRFIDDTTVREHDQLATNVRLASGAVVRCHATRWSA
jgi:hypothetical protein